MKYFTSLLGLAFLSLIAASAQAQTGSGSGSYTESGYTISVGPARYSKLVTYPTFGSITNVNSGGSYFSASTASSMGVGSLTIIGTIGGPGATQTLESYAEPTYELAVTVTPPTGVTASGSKVVTVSYYWEQDETYSSTMQATTLLPAGTFLSEYTATGPPSGGTSLYNYNATVITPLTPQGAYVVPLYPTAYTGNSGTSGWGYISGVQTITVTCAANVASNNWSGNSATFNIPGPASIPCYVSAYTSANAPTNATITNAIVPSPSAASF